MVDIHSHFLPGIDDGAKNVDMSLHLLQKSKKDGITGLVATPHFYSQEPVESFLEKRWNAYEKISSGTDLPIALGAEVYYTPSLREDNLLKLTMGGSSWLLLELPFARFHDRMFNDIQNMTCSMGLQVVIAHVERYIPYNSWADIKKLCAMDVTIQVNASDTESKVGKRLLKEDLVHFIASDMHDPNSRPQNLKNALERLGSAASMYIGNGDYLFESLPEVYLSGKQL